MCLEVGIESEGQEDCMSGFLSSAGEKKTKKLLAVGPRGFLSGENRPAHLYDF